MLSFGHLNLAASRPEIYPDATVTRQSEPASGMLATLVRPLHVPAVIILVGREEGVSFPGIHPDYAKNLKDNYDLAFAINSTNTC